MKATAASAQGWLDAEAQAPGHVSRLTLHLMSLHPAADLWAEGWASGRNAHLFLESIRAYVVFRLPYLSGD